MYHKIILAGNLGRDPKMRYTPNGRPVTDFSMATSDEWTGQDGQAQERTIWWRVTVWGKDAENANQILKKGSKVVVEGRMSPDPKTGNPRMWTGQDGTPRASYEVTALTWRNLSSASHGGESHGAGAEASSVEDSDVPSDDESGIPF
jgi:single-strand DNA-binding protein